MCRSKARKQGKAERLPHGPVVAFADGVAERERNDLMRLVAECTPESGGHSHGPRAGTEPGTAYPRGVAFANMPVLGTGEREGTGLGRDG